MKTNKGKRQMQRVVSLLTLGFFLFSQVAFANPGAGIEIAPARELPGFFQVDIPDNLASLDGIYEAPPSAESRIILHIQNAHANYGAQKKIKELLEYLNKTYSIKTIFVEGAAEDLNPNYLKFFPDKKQNLELADLLAQQGELTGAELYLLETEDRAVQGKGIEDAELYRKNYEALKKVFGEEATVNRYLNGFETRMEGVSTKVFTDEIRKTLADWKKFERGHREFVPYLRGLTADAKKVLNLDLESLFAQVEWPQITRLLVLQEMEKEVDLAKADEEKGKLTGFLKAQGISQKIIANLENFKGQRVSVRQGQTDLMRPRDLLEALVAEAGPKGFYFKDYPAFTLYAGYLILKNELDPKGLFEEIKVLFARILDALAQTPRQKELLRLYRDEELVRKLLSLELSRKEWVEVEVRKTDLGMDPLVDRLKELCVAVTREQNLPPSDLETKTISLKFRNEILGLYDAAAHFYEFARQREAAFFDKIDSVMRKEAVNKAVLITGGFHTDGMTDLFREHGISYGILTPRLMEKSDEKAYKTSMLQNEEQLFDISYLELASGATSLATLARQGIKPGKKLSTQIKNFWKKLPLEDAKDGQSVAAAFNRSMAAMEQTLDGKTKGIRLTYLGKDKGRERFKLEGLKAFEGKVVKVTAPVQSRPGTQGTEQKPGEVSGTVFDKMPGQLAREQAIAAGWRGGQFSRLVTSARRILGRVVLVAALAGGLSGVVGFTSGCANVVGISQTEASYEAGFSDPIPAEEMPPSDYVSFYSLFDSEKKILEEAWGELLGKVQDPFIRKLLSNSKWRDHIYVMPDSAGRPEGGAGGVSNKEYIAVDRSAIRGVVSDRSTVWDILVGTVLHELIHTTHLQKGMNLGSAEENTTRVQTAENSRAIYFAYESAAKTEKEKVRLYDTVLADYKRPASLAEPGIVVFSISEKGYINAYPSQGITTDIIAVANRLLQEHTANVGIRSRSEVRNTIADVQAEVAGVLQGLRQGSGENNAFLTEEQVSAWRAGLDVNTLPELESAVYELIKSLNVISAQEPGLGPNEPNEMQQDAIKAAVEKLNPILERIRARSETRTEEEVAEKEAAYAGKDLYQPKEDRPKKEREELEKNPERGAVENGPDSVAGDLDWLAAFNKVFGPLNAGFLSVKKRVGQLIQPSLSPFREIRRTVVKAFSDLGEVADAVVYAGVGGDEAWVRAKRIAKNAWQEIVKTITGDSMGRYEILRMKDSLMEESKKKEQMEFLTQNPYIISAANYGTGAQVIINLRKLKEDNKDDDGKYDEELLKLREQVRMKLGAFKVFQFETATRGTSSMSFGVVSRKMAIKLLCEVTGDDYWFRTEKKIVNGETVETQFLKKERIDDLLFWLDQFADDALYRAKELGRTQAFVVQSEEDLEGWRNHMRTKLNMEEVLKVSKNTAAQKRGLGAMVNIDTATKTYKKEVAERLISDADNVEEVFQFMVLKYLEAIKRAFNDLQSKEAFGHTGGNEVIEFLAEVARELYGFKEGESPEDLMKRGIIPYRGPPDEMWSAFLNNYLKGPHTDADLQGMADKLDMFSDKLRIVLAKRLFQGFMKEMPEFSDYEKQMKEKAAADKKAFDLEQCRESYDKGVKDAEEAWSKKAEELSLPRLAIVHVRRADLDMMNVVRNMLWEDDAERRFLDGILEATSGMAMIARFSEAMKTVSALKAGTSELEKAMDVRKGANGSMVLTFNPTKVQNLLKLYLKAVDDDMHDALEDLKGRSVSYEEILANKLADVQRRYAETTDAEAKMKLEDLIRKFNDAIARESAAASKEATGLQARSEMRLSETINGIYSSIVTGTKEGMAERSLLLGELTKNKDFLGALRTVAKISRTFSLDTRFSIPDSEELIGELIQNIKILRTQLDAYRGSRAAEAKSLKGTLESAIGKLGDLKSQPTSPRTEVATGGMAASVPEISLSGTLTPTTPLQSFQNQLDAIDTEFFSRTEKTQLPATRLIGEMAPSLRKLAYNFSRIVTPSAKDEARAALNQRIADLTALINNPSQGSVLPKLELRRTVYQNAQKALTAARSELREVRADDIKNGVFEIGGTRAGFGNTTSKETAVAGERPADVVMTDLDNLGAVAKLEAALFQAAFFDAMTDPRVKKYQEKVAEIKKLKAEGSAASVIEQAEKDLSSLIEDLRKSGYNDRLLSGVVWSRRLPVVVPNEAQRQRVIKILTNVFAAMDPQVLRSKVDVLQESLPETSRYSADMLETMIREFSANRSFTFPGGAFFDPATKQARTDEEIGRILAEEILDIRVATPEGIEVRGASGDMFPIRYEDGKYMIGQAGSEQVIGPEIFQQQSEVFPEWPVAQQETLRKILAARDSVLRMINLGTGDPTPFSRDQDYTNMALVRNGEIFLMDPSIRTIRNLEKMGLGNSVNTISLSHVHFDHVGGVLDLLRRKMQLGGTKVKLIAPVFVQAQLQELVAQMFGPEVDAVQRLSDIFDFQAPAQVDGLIAKYNMSGGFSDIKVESLRTFGHPLPTFGFKVTDSTGASVAYLSDSKMPDATLKDGTLNSRHQEMLDFYGTSDLLISENGVPGVHITPDQLVRDFQEHINRGSIFTVHAAGPQTAKGLQRFSPFMVLNVQTRADRDKEILEVRKLLDANFSDVDISPKTKDALATLLRLVDFEVGQTIFHEGEPVEDNPHVMLHLKGEYDVYVPGMEKKTHVPPTLLGEMGIVGKKLSADDYKKLSGVYGEKSLGAFITQFKTATGEIIYVWKAKAISEIDNIPILEQKNALNEALRASTPLGIRTATVQVTKPSRMLSMGYGTFMNLMAAYPDFAAWASEITENRLLNRQVAQEAEKAKAQAAAEGAAELWQAYETQEVPPLTPETPARSESRGDVKRGWTEKQMDLFNAAIGILAESGLSAIDQNLQKYLNGEVNGVYEAFLASNRDEGGVLAEPVSDLTVDIHNNYVGSQRGPGFVLYDQEMHDELYRAIQVELEERPEGMEHVKSKKEGNLTLELFLNPSKKWQLKLEHFKSTEAQEIIKAALRGKGVVEDKLEPVTINTLNNDYDKLAELKVEGSAWSQAKRKEFLAGLQATAIKEVLMVLNDTGTVRELVDAMERGDKEKATIAAVKLLAIIKIMHIVKMLREINLVWRLGNSWDAKAELPFSLREGALGFADIMLDAYIFLGMFQKLLKGGVSYELVPDVGESFGKLAKHQEEVIELFSNKDRLRKGMVRLDSESFIRKSGLNQRQQDALRSTDIVVADNEYLRGVMASRDQNGGVVLLGASVAIAGETPPLHKDLYEALYSTMGFQHWRAAYADVGIPVVEMPPGQKPEDVTNARSPEFLARLIHQNKKMVFLMPTNIEGHEYVKKELQLLLDAENNFELLAELQKRGVQNPQAAVREYLAHHVTFIFGMRAFLDKQAPNALAREQLTEFFSSFRSEARGLDEVRKFAQDLELEMTQANVEFEKGKTFGDVRVADADTVKDLATKVAFIVHGILDLNRSDPAKAAAQMTVLAVALGADMIAAVKNALPKDHSLPVTNILMPEVRFVTAEDYEKSLDSVKAMLILNPKYECIFVMSDSPGDRVRALKDWATGGKMKAFNALTRVGVMTESDYLAKETKPNLGTVFSASAGYQPAALNTKKIDLLRKNHMFVDLAVDLMQPNMASAATVTLVGLARKIAEKRAATKKYALNNDYKRAQMVDGLTGFILTTDEVTGRAKIAITTESLMGVAKMMAQQLQAVIEVSAAA